MDYLNYHFNSNKKSYTSGTDSPAIGWYRIATTYPYPVHYSFNSRGFRGKEWPKNLSNVIWCIGDSFTAGIGVPLEHTWPSILQAKTGIQCINLGINGAANNLIANIAKQVIAEYKPGYIAIMWSYLHRRYEDPWKFIHFEEDTCEKDNINYFIHHFNEVNNLSPNIYNTIVPRIDLPIVKTLNIYEYDVLDVGRDNWHFDYLTAEVIAESIIKHYNLERKLNEKN